MKTCGFLVPLVLLAVLFGLISTRQQVRAQRSPDLKRIIFIAGQPSHGPGAHEHRAGCLLLADHLNQSGLKVEAVVVHYGWPEDDAVFDGAAAVVIYADGGGGHPAMKHLDKLREMAANGIGIGMIHYAVEVPKGDGGSLFLDAIGGYFETGWSVNPHWDAKFEVEAVAHPVASGIADFEIRDEWYYHMRFRKGMVGITPILSALPPEDSLSRPDGAHSGNPQVRQAVLKRKEPQHVLWLFERPGQLGGGRAFGFTGGHFHKNWQHDDFRRVVLNAIAWLAGEEVPTGGVHSNTPSDQQMRANLDKK